MDFKQTPIPPLSTSLRNQGMLIQENGEPLSSVPGLSNPFIVDSPQYKKHGISEALQVSLVREEVGELLKKAVTLLPEGHSLVIWDGWRPYAVQKALFDEYFAQLKQETPDLTKSEIYEKTMKFVSPPSVDEKEPAPHITGGSVDLGIINENGALLDFGTAFDDFTEKSKTRYYEELLEQGKSFSAAEQRILENRRLLYHVMISCGFSNYFEEWWHFDYGNQWWALSYRESHAIYGLTQK